LKAILPPPGVFFKRNCPGSGGRLSAACGPPRPSSARPAHLPVDGNVADADQVARADRQPGRTGEAVGTEGEDAAPEGVGRRPDGGVRSPDRGDLGGRVALPAGDHDPFGMRREPVNGRPVETEALQPPVAFGHPSANGRVPSRSPPVRRTSRSSQKPGRFSMTVAGAQSSTVTPVLPFDNQRGTREHPHDPTPRVGSSRVISRLLRLGFPCSAREILPVCQDIEKPLEQAKWDFSGNKLPLQSPSLRVTFLRPGCGSAAGRHAEPSFSTAC